MALTQVSTAGVKDDAVTSGKIPANAVGSSEIADQAVTLDKLPHGTSSNNGKFLRANNGADPSFESIPAGITINNQADNRIITATGTTDTLNSEANLTFRLASADPILTVQGTSAGHAQLSLKTGGTTDHCSINFGDSGDGDIGEIRYTHSSDAMQFDTNNLERMRIDSSGNVGIGTQSPTHPLDVHTSGTEIARFQGANDARLKLRNSSSNLLLAYTDSGDAFQLGTGGQNPRVHITSGGDVGIGTTSPESKVAIKGSSGDGDLFSISDITVPTSGDEYGVAMIKSNAAANMLSITGYNSNSKGLRIYNNGGSAGRTSFEIAQAAGTKFLVDGVGRTLIGSSDGASYSSTAADDLIVGSAANGKNDGITILSGSAQNGSICFGDNNDDTAGMVSYVHNGDYLRFYAGSSQRARIDSDGLKFGSDSAANNALDDFEKGAWTPRIGPINNNSVYESGIGTYFKVGDKVTCYYAFMAKNPNSFGSAIARIWNLPYNIRHASNHNSGHDYGTCEMMHNISFNYNGKTFFYTSNNSSQIIGLESRTGNSWQDWTLNNFANNFYLHGHITYSIDHY